jgi:hypothetical protein
MSDGACTWRQSADEVVVMCHKVPRGAVRGDLTVVVQMRYLQVANRHTGVVYFEGKLFREIIPEVGATPHRADEVHWCERQRDVAARALVFWSAGFGAGQTHSLYTVWCWRAPPLGLAGAPY